MFRASYFCLLHIIFHTSHAMMRDPRYILLTQGEVWPKPWQENNISSAFKVDPTKIEFKVTGKNCKKVQAAIDRCKDYVNILLNITKYKYSEKYTLYNTQDSHLQLLEVLEINLSQDCEEYPNFDMNESYNLTVSTKSTLNSTSVWGIIRGMETFTQLFYLTIDFKEICIKGTTIIDRPNYPHRALMLDTGRHYLSLKNILKTLDAMAMNKLNVFHWHIVDDQSFPFQSSKLPKLSSAAFHPTMVYTKSDLKKVRDYASNLGIRVLMEIDVPGHSSYWADSYPEVVTHCVYTEQPPSSYPLNPMKNETYDRLKVLLQEVQELFPDNYFHLGGDEIDLDCWKVNEEVSKYMTEKNSKDVNIVLALFFKKVISLLKNGTVPVVWQEVFKAKDVLPKNTLIQTWKGEDGSDSMAEVLNAGFRGIQSGPYYLDILEHQVDWFYKHEPRLAVKDKLNNDTLLQNLVGGTACMWGEMVDDANVLSRVWPRASGFAEVLWSETDGESPDISTYLRIEEHTCRMRRRGIPAHPAIGPSFCLL